MSSKHMLAQNFFAGVAFYFIINTYTRAYINIY